MADKLGRSRTRNFATVVYPDSAPEGWQELLVQQFVPALVSPLHDRDINPTGEPKKPHYHVILAFDNVKTIEQAQEVFSVIGGVGCEPVKSLRAYTRYPCATWITRTRRSTPWMASGSLAALTFTALLTVPLTAIPPSRKYWTSAMTSISTASGSSCGSAGWNTLSGSAACVTAAASL